MDEMWKQIAGYEGTYEVSSLGRVRSAPRTVKRSGHTMQIAGRILAPAVNPVTKYLYVSLWRDGIGATVAVHRLVAEAFIGPCPEGQQCGHLDGDRGNPTASNLCWVTRVENMSHKHIHGTAAFGERCNSAKLRTEQVRELRRRFAAGERRRDIAASLGIGIRTVYNVARYNTWKTVA